jgi:hypothetical protein
VLPAASANRRYASASFLPATRYGDN